MEYVGDATEQDMLDAFVRAEGDIVGRGYPDRYLFAGYPRDCAWLWATFTASDLRQVHHIRNEESWVLMSGPDRSPVVAGEWAQLMTGADAATKILQYRD